VFSLHGQEIPLQGVLLHAREQKLAPSGRLSLETADAVAQIAETDFQDACHFWDIVSGLLECLHKDGPLERVPP
jgi:hypothetical protein